MAGLGDALLAEGDPGAAGTAWREAVAILDRLPHPLADEVRIRLRGLPEASHGRAEQAAADPAGPADRGHLTGAATAAR